MGLKEISTLVCHLIHLNAKRKKKKKQTNKMVCSYAQVYNVTKHTNYEVWDIYLFIYFLSKIIS